jgi:hypothetical protein
MWTPKRILLLVLGFVTFWLAYGVYAYFLGGVDGLPPLPPECEASKTPDLRSSANCEWRSAMNALS